ncbi:MAG: leucine-rich repeat domain-containing protein [Treponema sp.]
MATDGFIFSADGKTLLECDFARLGTVVDIPPGCTKIANGVFAEAPVTNVSLPDTVTEAGDNLFSASETLKEVKLSANLKELKPFMFAGCSSLEKISMSENVSFFPAGLFWGCSSLKEIPFRNGIESLEVDVFRDMERLKSIQIPPSVKIIKSGALAGCTNLSAIVFPESLEKIEDRSLANLPSLEFMRFSGENENFFVDENSGSLYELTESGAVLIKCPVNIESVRLVENTCDVHIDAFECCKNLAEVCAYENAPETLINRLLELVPQIDINSYGDDISDEEKFDEDAGRLAENLDDVKVDDSEFSEKEFSAQENSIQAENEEIENPDLKESAQAEQNYGADIDSILEQNITHKEDSLEGIILNQDELARLFSNSENQSDESALSESAFNAGSSVQSEPEFAVDVESILNDQCCRNFDLDEGFRPVTDDELERLFSSAQMSPSAFEQIPVSESEVKAESSLQKENSSETEKTDEPKLTEEKSAEEKPKKKRSYKRKKTSKKDAEKQALEKSETEKPEVEKSEADNTEISAVENEVIETPKTEEPRFIRAMKNLAAHKMILEEDENKIDSVYGDLQELIVIADGIAPSTNDFSSHLVKFVKDLAKKYGFTKIYFFENLPLDDPEFIYGLESFGNLRNVLYACNKPCAEKISDTQKELINATGIPLSSSKIENVKTLKEKADGESLHYPVKIIVQDEYVEGLLYCAEKYRQAHGII